MFEIGEHIVYGNIGICEIVDIKKLDIQEKKTSELYYIMRPFQEPSSQVFTPIDNKKIVMRKIMSEAEAETLIQNMPHMEVMDITNDKLREQVYKEALHSCDSKEWARILIILYLRKQERLSQGKKVTATDERYIKTVEARLFTELELALHLSKDKIASIIQQKMTHIS